MECSYLRLLLFLGLMGTPLLRAAPPAPLQLLSYNIRVDFDGSSWDEREPAIAAIFTEQPDDLIAIQEASELMIASFQSILPDYSYVVGERSDGHRGDQRWYEFCPIFWRPERLTKLSAGSFWIGDQPDRPGDNLDNTKHHGRVFTWVAFRDNISESEFVYGNVHIHGQRSHDAVALIVDRLRDQFEDTPLILSGDFNSRPESEAYTHMTTEFDFLDAHQQEDEPNHPITTLGIDEKLPAGNGNWIRGQGGARIDYIFFDRRFGLQTYKVVRTTISPGVFPSDHLPLAATFSPPATKTQEKYSK